MRRDFSQVRMSARNLSTSSGSLWRRASFSCVLQETASPRQQWCLVLQVGYGRRQDCHTASVRGTSTGFKISATSLTVAVCLAESDATSATTVLNSSINSFARFRAVSKVAARFPASNAVSIKGELVTHSRIAPAYIVTLTPLPSTLSEDHALCPLRCDVRRVYLSCKPKNGSIYSVKTTFSSRYQMTSILIGSFLD